MTEDSFDSEVMQLIDDLGLVRIGSLEYREFLAILAVSEYTNYWFCERWLARKKEQEKERNRLLRAFQKKNSKYVYQSLSYQTRIRWQD